MDFNFTFDAFEEQDGTWVVTIYCNKDPIFMAAVSNGESAAIYGQAFTDGAKFMLVRKTS